MGLGHGKILITGQPGVGKTTLVKAIIDGLRPIKMAGFYTKEIRSKGSRSGFKLIGLNGMHRILAHVDIDSPHRVGRYGVDTSGFDSFLEKMDLLRSGIDLIVIDEIGKMELFSKHFRLLIHDIFNSEKQLLATIAMKGGGLIREIKQRPDIKLMEVTLSNRYRLATEIMYGSQNGQGGLGKV